MSNPVEKQLFLILNTTPDGVWVPLVAYESYEEAEALVGSFAEAKAEALKQGVTGRGAAAMFAGRAVALDSTFGVANIQVKIVKPEQVVRLVKPASELGGLNVIK